MERGMESSYVRLEGIKGFGNVGPDHASAAN